MFLSMNTLAERIFPYGENIDIKSASVNSAGKQIKLKINLSKYN